jgi:hypothetical protein
MQRLASMWKTGQKKATVHVEQPLSRFNPARLPFGLERHRVCRKTCFLQSGLFIVV